jgi:F0F1-type ATP synthase assembly protein I
LLLALWLDFESLPCYNDKKMTKAADPTTTKNPTEQHPANTPPQKLRVGRELADTTWRMAVPVVLFAGLGIVADRSLGSKPWLTLLGVIVGFACAGLLVKRQLDRWPASLPKPGSYERNRKPGDDEDKDYYND